MVSSRYEIVPTAHQDQKVVREFTNQSLDEGERIRNFSEDQSDAHLRDVLALTGVAQRAGCPIPERWLV